MRDTDNFIKYIRLVMRHQQGMQLSAAATHILNQMLIDIMDQLATEAANVVKYSKRKTLSTRDLVCATKLFLPQRSQEGHFDKHSKGLHTLKRLNNHHQMGHRDGRKRNHSRQWNEGGSALNYEENSMDHYEEQPRTNISEVVKHFQNALGTRRGERFCVCAYIE